MCKILQNGVNISIFILLLVVSGCGKGQENIPTPLPEGPKIPEVVNFEGIDFIDVENCLSFKYYPEYKETHRDERGAIFSKEEGSGERIVFIIWELDLDTYMWFVDTFSHPLTLKKRLKKELKVPDEIISYRVLEKEGTDAFLFTTRRSSGRHSGLYNQRVELFPKEEPLQISLLFQHKKEDEQKVLDMIGSIRIVGRREKGKK